MVFEIKVRRYGWVVVVIFFFIRIYSCRKESCRVGFVYGFFFFELEFFSRSFINYR